MITRYDYFYDSQCKRYLTQMVRAFSGFQYMTGDRGPNKPAQLRMVPCSVAKRNRQVAAIQRNMSENTLLTVPMITVDIASFEHDRERMQNPNHIDSVQVTERARDIITGGYTDERGNRATVERLMPVPFTITFQVDIWTSNMDQKFMLIEQIATHVFPGFDIQNSDNAVDWSALTTATLEALTYSSVSIPIGTDNEIDVATFTFKVPMWLTPPARVTRQNLISQVIANINQAEKDENGVIVEVANLARVVTTPGNHHIHVERDRLTLLGANGQEFASDGSIYNWSDLLAGYGSVLHPSETQIRLKSALTDDPTNDIVGYLFPTDEPNVVLWQPDIDTLPSNTLPSVTGIIDPQRSIPGEGALLSAEEGQRYLVINDLAEASLIWGDITARAGSIIEFSQGAWRVSFNSANHQRTEYVTNKNTGRQLGWNIAEQSWVMALDGIYAPGFWRLATI